MDQPSGYRLGGCSWVAPPGCCMSTACPSSVRKKLAVSLHTHALKSNTCLKIKLVNKCMMMMHLIAIILLFVLLPRIGRAVICNRKSAVSNVGKLTLLWLPLYYCHYNNNNDFLCANILEDHAEFHQKRIKQSHNHITMRKSSTDGRRC